MSESMVEYRNTKEILDSIIRKASKYSNYEFKSIYQESTKKMFFCVRKTDSKNIYEVKVTKKARSEGIRITPDNDGENKDFEKETFLAEFATVVGCVFNKVFFHEGNVLISDTNNDYIVSMIKKSSLSWENKYEKKECQ